MTITRSAGGLIPYIGGNAGTERTATGQWTETIVAGGNQEIFVRGNGFTGTVDNIVVRPVATPKRMILRPDEYTLEGNTLILDTQPPQGTGNVIVFAPSLL